MEKINILGSKINVTNKDKLVYNIDEFIKSKKSHYICVSNVHTVATGIQNIEYRRITNSASMAIPDGMPLVWIAKHRGYKDISKCSGPDIMTELFKVSEEKGYTHYFYGGAENTLKVLEQELKSKYPKLKILKMDSPPFRKLTEEEDKKVIDRINDLNPDIIWVGLGAPKQEIWMYEHVKKINKSVIFGVGAAFNFHAGSVKRAPLWMQTHGLEWLYRLVKEPKRLWKRYLVTNSIFIFYLLFYRKKLER